MGVCFVCLYIHTYHKINIAVLILKILHQLLKPLCLHAHLQKKNVALLL